jgi:hypothetical protein
VTETIFHEDRNMTMAKKLRDAGVDVDHARLTELAFNAIKFAKGDVGAATDRLLSVVMNNGRLLAALMELSEAKIRERAAQFIGERTTDMRGSSRGQGDSATKSGSGSQSLNAGQYGADPASAAGGGAASQVVGDSHLSPVRRPAPVSEEMRTAAVAVARSVFDERISESIGFVWRDLTGHKLVNVLIKSEWLGAIGWLLLPKWGGRDLYRPLPEVVSEKELKAIIAKADAKRLRTAEAARQVTYV